MKGNTDESSSHTVSTSTSTSGPARAIRLVYCDEKGKFQMDPEAVSILQLVKEHVGVVSVCGRAGQGKSFILNQLLGRSSGFQVSSTHRPCTKGLWMWSTPIKTTAPDGTEHSLLLIDSEGIDANDQTETYSTQIFSLAILLSSMVIYNQMGGVDEAALDRLSLVTEMTKHIRVRASGGKNSATELGQFSPVFVWLLRDFYLNVVVDNRKITPRDYLEIALRPVHGGVRDFAVKNEIRDFIRALFPDRDCFTLVRPLNYVNELQQLDQIPLEKMRPEFRKGVEGLTSFVFERTRPKQVGATVMTGPVFACIAQCFIDALNNGTVPTITFLWQKAMQDLEVANLKSRNIAAEEEAEEWKQKYNVAVRESKSALEKAVVAVQDRSNKQAQQREDVLRAEFAATLADKDDDLKDMASKLKNDEQRITALSLQLKEVVSEKRSEVANLKLMFERRLTAYDAIHKKSTHIEIPKRSAEKFFPQVSEQRKRINMKNLDIESSKELEFCFTYWPNSGSRRYVLEGFRDFLVSKKLQEGDTVSFYQTELGGKMTIGYRKT